MDYMKEAVKEAFSGIEQGEGGPFGAVVVKDGEIIARGHNRVILTNDATAHAEIVAIRRASEKLGRFDLSDCEIYSTCEPCPMCYSAIHWAKIGKLYYGATRKDAADLGFDDQLLYDLLGGKRTDDSLSVEQVQREECLEPFREFEKKEDKKMY